MKPMSSVNEIGTEAAASAVGVFGKTAPPAAVSAISLAGVGLSDWVYIATLIWIAIQAGVFVYDRIKKHKARKASQHHGRSKVFRDGA